VTTTHGGAVPAESSAAPRPARTTLDDVPPVGAAPRDEDAREHTGQGRPRSRHPRRIAAVIVLIGVALTLVSAWAADRIDRNTEQRLLDMQTRQAATVLSTAITAIDQALGAGLGVARSAVASGADSEAGGGARAFDLFMADQVGPGKTFQTASLWSRHGGSLHRLATVGAPPVMPPSAPATLTHLAEAFGKTTTTVRFVRSGDRVHVVYVRADPEQREVVYAERLIAANRRAPVDRDSAFSELQYAIYLGPDVKRSALSTTDVDPASLPLQGRTSRTSVPFGDNVLTLTTKARGHLGAPLGEQLPWLLLLTGLVLTGVAARAGLQLERGRQTAEDDAATITSLYQRAERLFAQQRELFVSLQRALLPHVNPQIPNVELASEYIAGARGLDIGGDWFSIIDLPDSTRFGFVVGDVSGRGVDAVAVMAHARFTIRAYLLDDDDPATVLAKCAPQFDIATDGHMVTALVGVGDWRTGELTLASAGHPPPALVTAGGVSFVDVTPGRPLGTGADPYPTTTITMTPGATLLCYTDGLVERRGEDIDAGMERLAGVLAPMADRPVDELVAHALHVLRHDDAADDIATLAIRWTGGR
jgi:serine phosphatase RsbU (regulator of sigma subunit)/type II secretory pathway pseudopilin PulG